MTPRLHPFPSQPRFFDVSVHVDSAVGIGMEEGGQMSLLDMRAGGGPPSVSPLPGRIEGDGVPWLDAGPGGRHVLSSVSRVTRTIRDGEFNLYGTCCALYRVEDGAMLSAKGLGEGGFGGTHRQTVWDPWGRWATLNTGGDLLVLPTEALGGARYVSPLHQIALPPEELPYTRRGGQYGRLSLRPVFRDANGDGQVVSCLGPGSLLSHDGLVVTSLPSGDQHLLIDGVWRPVSGLAWGWAGGGGPQAQAVTYSHDGGWIVVRFEGGVIRHWRADLSLEGPPSQLDRAVAGGDARLQAIPGERILAWSDQRIDSVSFRGGGKTFSWNSAQPINDVIAVSGLGLILVVTDAPAMQTGRCLTLLDSATLTEQWRLPAPVLHARPFSGGLMIRDTDWSWRVLYWR